MVYLKRQPQAEFPQFRTKLAAMGAWKRQSVARESLHSLERTLSQLVPAEEVQKLGSLPGTPPLSLVFVVVSTDGDGPQLIHSGSPMFDPGMVAAEGPFMVRAFESGIW